MSAKKEFKKLDKDLAESFGNVASDFEHVNGRVSRVTISHNILQVAFKELRDELATNGVIRDLRKFEKELANFDRAQAAFNEEIYGRFRELENNGVATAINKLNAEVFKPRKSTETGFIAAVYRNAGIPTQEEATLAGKVDAIIAHLGIDVTVKPLEVISAEIVVKKKPVTKKKGRR